MKLLIFGVALLLSTAGTKVYAQQTPELEFADSQVGTESAVASPSAEATGAANLVERVTERRPDITEPRGEVQGKLEQILSQQEVGPLSWHNFLQHAVRRAVMMGVPANTLVLVILFPVVAAVIAAGRHLIGLRGFGIFVPAVLSVAFVATGILVGILLFLIILLVATLSRRIIRRLKMQYLPRMALLLWFVSVGVLGTLLLAPVVGMQALVTISIFPILILILLAENFIEVQIGKSREEAVELTAETIILALICSLVLSLEYLQRFAILNPELLLLVVAGFDVFVGRYVGLRFTEYLTFRKVIQKK